MKKHFLGFVRGICSFEYGYHIYMGVSKNNGTPKSSLLIGFSIINHPFWDTPIFGNTHIVGGIYFTDISYFTSSRFNEWTKKQTQRMMSQEKKPSSLPTSGDISLGGCLCEHAMVYNL